MCSLAHFSSLVAKKAGCNRVGLLWPVGLSDENATVSCMFGNTSVSLVPQKVFFRRNPISKTQLLKCWSSWFASLGQVTWNSKTGIEGIPYNIISTVHRNCSSLWCKLTVTISLNFLKKEKQAKTSKIMSTDLWALITINSNAKC